MIPEPTTALWLELRKMIDSFFPVWVDEDAAQRMGDSWAAAAEALGETVAQATSGLNALPSAWPDANGILYHDRVRDLINGVGTGGYGEIIQMMNDMATMSHDYARQIANIKDSIYAELIANGLAFAASFALPLPLGQWIRGRIVVGIATRIGAIVRAAAAAMRLSEGAANLLVAAGKEIGKEMIEEPLTEIGGETIDIIRGYREQLDPKQIAIAAGAGGGGAVLAPILKPVGWLASKPVGAAVRRIPAPARFQPAVRGVGNSLERQTHAFVVNGISSPVTSVTAQAVADGKLGDLTWNDLGKAVYQQGLGSGALASGRITAHETGHLAGHYTAARLHPTPSTPPPHAPQPPAPETPHPTQPTTPTTTPTAQTTPTDLTQSHPGTTELTQPHPGTTNTPSTTSTNPGSTQTSQDLQATPRPPITTATPEAHAQPTTQPTATHPTTATTTQPAAAQPTVTTTQPASAQPTGTTTQPAAAQPPTTQQPTAQQPTAQQPTAQPPAAQRGAAAQEPNAAQPAASTQQQDAAEATTGQPSATAAQSAPPRTTTQQPGSPQPQAQNHPTPATTPRATTSTSPTPSREAPQTDPSSPNPTNPAERTPQADPTPPNRTDPAERTPRVDSAPLDPTNPAEDTPRVGATASYRTAPTDPADNAPSNPNPSASASDRVEEDGVERGLPVLARVGREASGAEHVVEGVRVSPVDGESLESTAQRAFIEALNERGADGELTPAARGLRGRYYATPDGLKGGKPTGTVHRRSKSGTFEAVLPDGRVLWVQVPELRYLTATGDFGGLQKVPAVPKVGGRTDVLFGDPALGEGPGDQQDVQSDTDRWIEARQDAQSRKAAEPENQTPNPNQDGSQDAGGDGSQHADRDEHAGRDEVQEVGGEYRPTPQQAGERMGDGFAKLMLRWLGRRGGVGEEVHRVFADRALGSGRFDQIFVRLERGTGRVLGFVIGEAKNVGGELGYRRMHDLLYQQGHREYIRSILLEMIRRAGPTAVLDNDVKVDGGPRELGEGPKSSPRHVRADVPLENEAQLAEAMLAALDAGQLEFFMVKPLLLNGRTALGLSITEFDLTAPTPTAAPTPHNHQTPPHNPEHNHNHDAGRTHNRESGRESPHDHDREGGREFPHDHDREGGRESPHDHSRAGGREFQDDHVREGERDPGNNHDREGGQESPPNHDREGGRESPYKHEREGGRETGDDHNPERHYGPERGYGHGHGVGVRANRGVVEGGGGLARTAETVVEVAGAAGVDLSGIDVVILNDAADYARLDDQQAMANAQQLEDGTVRIQLGPASFVDRETLAATLAHEKTHADQFRAGRVSRENVPEMETEAYASEASALERLHAHDQVHDRDHVRPAESARPRDPRQDPERGGPGRHGPPGRGDGSGRTDPGGGVVLFRPVGDDPGGADPGSGARPAAPAGDGARRPGLRFLPGFLLVGNAVAQAITSEIVLQAANVQEVVQLAANRYQVTTTDGRTYVLHLRIGPLGPTTVARYVAVPNTTAAEVTFSDHLALDEVPQVVARVLAETAAATTDPTPAQLAGIEETLTVHPSGDPELDPLLKAEDHGALAEARALAAEHEAAPSGTRRRRIRQLMATLVASMSLGAEQPNAELRHTLVSRDDSAMAERFQDRRSPHDDRVPRRAYVVKSIRSSVLSAVVIGAAGYVHTGSIAVGVALTVPTMVNSLIGALAEHWLDGRKDEGSTSAYDAEKALRAEKYQGMKGMLDGTPEAADTGDKLPRATKRVNYLVRHAVPLLAATGTAGVLGLLGIPAMSTIAVIGTTALAKTLTERLVDRRNLDLRIARLDAAMRRQLSDPAALQNQLVALLQDYHAQLDVLRAQLTGTQTDLPAPTDGPEIVDSPGTPSFALQLAAQSIENVTAAARRLLSHLSTMQNQNPAQQPGNGAAQLELLTDALINAVGPAVTSLLLGAVGDKIFFNTEERASDAQKLWDEAERDAVRGQALVDVLTDQLQRVDDAVEQLRQSVADHHPDVDLGDRTLDRMSFPTAPAHPAGTRPPGQSKFRAYLLQVAFAAIGAAGGALALDQIFDLDDYSVVITVAGSVGGVIGTPVARLLFRRAELRRKDQNAFDLGKQDVDRSVLNKQVAFGKYLVAQLLDQIQQLHEQVAAQAVDVRPGDPGYTDRIRAAAEQAYLDNLQATHPDVQLQRVRLLERIDQLAAALDWADASEIEQAQTRLAYAIALYEGIVDEDGTSKAFPDVRQVAPGRGARVTGGPTDQVRAGAARALRRILGEPGDKPRLEERLVALEEIVRAANAVDAHKLAGTPRSRAAVQEQLTDRIAAYEDLLAQTNLPGGFPRPAISP